MEAAHTLAKRGHKVTLFEKMDALGGEQLELAKVPPYKQDLVNIPEYYTNQFLKLNNLQLLLSKEADGEAIKALSPDVVVVATGSKPIIPNIPGGEKTVTAWEVLAGHVEVGEKTIIVGANAIGSETAEWLATQKKKVVLVEMLDEIGRDVEPVTRHALLQRLATHGVEILAGKKVIEVIDHGVICLDRQGERIPVKGDMVVFAVGARSNDELFANLKGTVDKIFLIGDAKEPGKIINATSEAYKISRDI